MITSKNLLKLIKNTFNIEFDTLKQVNNARMTWVTIRTGDEVTKYFSPGGREHFRPSILRKNSYIIVKYSKKDPSNNRVNIRVPLSADIEGKLYLFKTMPMYEEINIKKFALINNYVKLLNFILIDENKFFNKTIDNCYCIDFSIENIDKIFITNRYGVLNKKEYISTQMESPFVGDNYIKPGLTLLYTNNPINFMIDLENRCIYSHFINEIIYMLNLTMDFDFVITNVDDIDRLVDVLNMIEI